MSKALIQWPYRIQLLGNGACDAGGGGGITSLDVAYTNGNFINLVDSVPFLVNGPGYEMLSINFEDKGETQDSFFVINTDTYINNAIAYQIITNNATLNSTGLFAINGGNINLVSAGSLTLKDQYLQTPLPVAEPGETDLVGFAATSTIGCFNELKAGSSASVEFKGSFQKQAQSIVAPINHVSNQNLTDYPTTSSSDFIENGNLTPWCNGSSIVNLVKLSITFIQCAVSQGTVGASPFVRFTLYDNIIGGRISLGNIDVPITDVSEIGVFNSLGNNFEFSYTYTFPAAIVIPPRTNFGGEFQNLSSLNSEINAIGRITGFCLEGVKV